jgi:hypothetical protein
MKTIPFEIPKGLVNPKTLLINVEDRWSRQRRAGASKRQVLFHLVVLFLALASLPVQYNNISSSANWS